MLNLNSYRILKYSLGEYDAVIQYQECARRAFMEKYELMNKKNAIDFPEFLSLESSKYQINLRNLTIDNYLNIIFKSYLVIPNSLLEEFVDNFMSDYNKLFFSEEQLNNNNKDKCKLERLVDFLNKKGITNGGINLEDLKLYNYYRFIRNSLAHKSI